MKPRERPREKDNRRTPLSRIAAPAKALWKNRYFALFLTFFKASSFTFVGGLAVVAAIEHDAVEKYRLLNRQEFLEYATLSQTLPGVIALNCALLVGRHAAGFAGMLAAGFGAILPAFSLMLAATIFSGLIPRQGPLLGTMQGIRAASAALVLSAAFSLGRGNLKGAFSIVVMLAAFFFMAFGNLSAPLIVALAGMAGGIYRYILRRREKGSPHAD